MQEEKQEVAENQNAVEPAHAPVKWWFLATICGTAMVVVVAMWTVGLRLAEAFDQVEDGIQAHESRIDVLENNTLTAKELLKMEHRLTETETLLKSQQKDISDLEKDSHIQGYSHDKDRN